MNILIDDVGSFPLPVHVDSNTFGKAYRSAREAIAKGERLENDEFLRTNFYDVVIDSFGKKLQSGLDVTNFPQQYDGIRQIGDVLHKTMESGTFVVEEKDAFLPEVRVIGERAKELSEEFEKKIRPRFPPSPVSSGI